MLNKIKQFINKILSFNIGNLFKFEMNNKVADKQENKLVEVNNIDNSQQIVQQKFVVAILPGINVDESIKQALALGNENASAIGVDVQELLTDNNISQDQINKNLSNPEVLSTIAKANEIAYTTNDIEKRKMLSDLIYKKISTEYEEDSITLSQAIVTMRNFTKNHLKLNALFYLFRSGYLKEFSSAQEFINFYNKYLIKLTDIPHDKLRDTGTAIIGNGCAVTYTFGSNVSDFFDNQIVEYIAKLATKENISDEEENQKNIIDKLNNIWFQTGLTSSFPTPIGKCIGKTYLHDIIGLDIIEKTKSESNNRVVTHNDLSQIYKYE